MVVTNRGFGQLARDHHMESANKASRFAWMRRAGRRSFGVTGWLLLLALVPLSGAAWFALNELEAVAADRDQAARVSGSTNDLVKLIELQTRLLEERTWSTAVVAVEAFGLDASIATTMIGVDLDAETRSAQGDVDRLLTEIGWPELEVAVLDLRNDEDADAVVLNDGYEDLADLVETRGAEWSDSLLAAASDIENGSQLVVAIGILEASAQARQLNSLQMTSYFGAQFGDIVMAPEALQSLIEQRGAYRSAMDELERNTGADSETSKALVDLESSSEVIAFREAVDRAPRCTAGGHHERRRFGYRPDLVSTRHRRCDVPDHQPVDRPACCTRRRRGCGRAGDQPGARRLSGPSKPRRPASHRNRGGDLAVVRPGPRTRDRTAIASARQRRSTNARWQSLISTETVRPEGNPAGDARPQRGRSAHRSGGTSGERVGARRAREPGFDGDDARVAGPILARRRHHPHRLAQRQRRVQDLAGPRGNS